MTAKPPYLLAAIDLDETLLGRDHAISPRNARAVRALADRGVACVIASGRMHEATTRYADELGLAGPIISYSGAMVRDTRTGDLWHHAPVPPDAAAEVIEFCAREGLHLNFYADERVYVARRGPWAELYLRQTGSPMVEVGDLRRLIGRAPTKLLLVDTPETADRLLDHFRAHFGDSLWLTRTNPEYLEFMNPAANKGSALELVADRMGVPREHTVAFGDGNNDLAMIQWAGLGVAMGTAKPAVRAAAGYVAPPFDEDGLGRAIEDIFGLGFA